jgi:hypothetical protein
VPIESVEYIFARQLTNGDFYSIERAPSLDEGGGSQTYIDIPLGRLTADQLVRFLGNSNGVQEGDAWPTLSINAFVLGDTAVSASLHFSPRGSQNQRYKINNQARRRSSSQRHPAWSGTYGFPEVSDELSGILEGASDPRLPDVSGIKILIIKTYQGNYYASYIQSNVLPSTWPQDIGLERLFQQGFSSEVINYSQDSSFDLSPEANKILKMWQKNETKNILLYGAPGTGKTHIMQEVWQFLNQGNQGNILNINTDSKVANAFSKTATESFGKKIRCDWITFHQNFSYEQFIVALRPSTKDNKMILQPHAGVLLDAMMSVHNHECDAAFLFIDEVNRGNVSRIFGEFITFMEDDYRAGNKGKSLPVPIHSSVTCSDGNTEPIYRMLGGELSLPIPLYFPQNIYILASMNSVDRAVAPLDTALSRRFSKIEISPSMYSLSEKLNIEISKINDINKKISSLSDEDNELIEIMNNPSYVAYYILYRINYILASTLGYDYEIGHTYLYRIGNVSTEDEKWLEIARAWDQYIYPQLRERFNSRPEILAIILNSDSNSVFRERIAPPASISTLNIKPVMEIPRLEECIDLGEIQKVKQTLKRLAGW